MFVLTDPISTGRSTGRPSPSTVAESAHLDRIAERRAGAVRLDVVDVGRSHAAERQRRADHRFLRRAVRRGQAAAASVLIDGGRHV